MYRRSLRFRVTAAFAALGAVLAGLLALATWWTAERMEATFIEATIDQELEFFMAEWLRDPAVRAPATRDIRGLVVPRDRLDQAPATLRDLGPGQYERMLDGRSFEIGIRDAGDHRFFLLYDERQIEKVEGRLIAWMIVAGVFATLISGAFGWALGGRITAPVRALADRVRDLDPFTTRGLAGGDFAADDEVGRLAASFDEACTRMQGFLERERTFTADASHQLRTSVAAIASTVELLLADPSLEAPARDRLRRLAQAASHLSRQIEAFLFLAREPGDDTTSPCPVVEAVEALIERERVLLPTASREIRFDPRARPSVRAPEAALDIVVGNLLRNAIAHGHGPIEIATSSDGIEVVDHGPALPSETLARAFDRGFRGNGRVPGNGLGLAIARRVAERYGWRIDLESAPLTGTVSRVRFPA